jgi:predicted ATPase
MPELAGAFQPSFQIAGMRYWWRAYSRHQSKLISAVFVFGHYDVVQRFFLRCTTLYQVAGPKANCQNDHNQSNAACHVTPPKVPSGLIP